mmetsp:Transcript_100098/g.322804  ORF Transcript_100098/g.322804 Transcript_100098/m.322804 type:complete len:504 (-) Transcript_100098:90-1601(-)
MPQSLPDPATDPAGIQPCLEPAATWATESKPSGRFSWSAAGTAQASEPSMDGVVVCNAPPPIWNGKVRDSERQELPSGLDRRSCVGSLCSRHSFTSPSRRSARRSDIFAHRCAQTTSSLISSQSSCISTLLMAKVATKRTKRSRRVHDVWQFLEEPESSSAARRFACLMPYLIAASVLFSSLCTTEPPLIGGHAPQAVEFGFDLIFAAEAFARLVVSPRRCAFFCSLPNCADAAAGIPLIFRVAILCAHWQFSSSCGSCSEVFRSIVPVLRLLKLLRSFEKFHLLVDAFKLAFEALPVLLFTLCVIVLSFSAVIFFVEPRDNIRALPQAIWFTIVTMMTVGFGDVVPQSTAGSIVVSALIVGSALYMAIPLGIVGGSFSRVWEDRDRLLLMRRTRARLRQWGYTPPDVLELFYIYDRDKSGELTLRDFSKMIQEMRLGIGADRVERLFRTFDTDGSGRLDDEEFVRALYPNAFAQLYQVSDDVSAHSCEAAAAMHKRSSEPQG